MIFDESDTLCNKITSHFLSLKCLKLKGGYRLVVFQLGIILNIQLLALASHYSWQISNILVLESNSNAFSPSLTFQR